MIRGAHNRLITTRLLWHSTEVLGPALLLGLILSKKGPPYYCLAGYQTHSPVRQHKLQFGPTAYKFAGLGRVLRPESHEGHRSPSHEMAGMRVCKAGHGRFRGKDLNSPPGHVAKSQKTSFFLLRDGYFGS